MEPHFNDMEVVDKWALTNKNRTCSNKCNAMYTPKRNVSAETESDVKHYTNSSNCLAQCDVP